MPDPRKHPEAITVERVNTSKTPWAVVCGRVTLTLPVGGVYDRTVHEGAGSMAHGARPYHRTKAEALRAKDLILTYLEQAA